MYPFGVGRSDDRLRGWSDDVRLVKLAGGNKRAIGAWFQAVMGYDRAFFGETLNMFGFFFEKAYWDQ